MKVFGPYVNTYTFRMFMTIENDDGSRTTISYPKYIMEEKLGRKLNITETIHHIDGDYSNNDFDNLEIKDVSKHASDDAKRAKPII